MKQARGLAEWDAVQDAHLNSSWLEFPMGCRDYGGPGVGAVWDVGPIGRVAAFCDPPCGSPFPFRLQHKE
ncbi:hypothetical protein JCM17961_20690 [Endothiovibrio diazotrophicus]